MERAYTSTIVKAENNDIKPNVQNFIPTNKNTNETTFNDKIRFFKFRDMNNDTNTSLDTENSTKETKFIIASTDDDFILAPKITENDQSQSIFNKIGTKFGDTFRKNEENNCSTGNSQLRNSVFPPSQGFLRNIFTKRENASKITTKTSVTDKLGLTDLQQKLENLDISGKRKGSDETILTSNGQNDSIKMSTSSLSNLKIPNIIWRIEMVNTPNNVSKSLNIIDTTNVNKVVKGNCKIQKMIMTLQVKMTAQILNHQMRMEIL